MNTDGASLNDAVRDGKGVARYGIPRLVHAASVGDLVEDLEESDGLGHIADNSLL